MEIWWNNEGCIAIFSEISDKLALCINMDKREKENKKQWIDILFNWGCVQD